MSNVLPAFTQPMFWASTVQGASTPNVLKFPKRFFNEEGVEYCDVLVLNRPGRIERRRADQLYNVPNKHSFGGARMAVIRADGSPKMNVPNQDYMKLSGMLIEDTGDEE